MLRSPRTSFAESDEGRAFYAAYDALLAKWPRGTVIHDLDSRFGTTRVTEYGPPEAPPVLLLPGAGATSMVWFATAAALGEAHRVLAVDILGDVGRSVADGDPVRNVDDLLGWLGSVADALGATRCALVGHSYGAMIALAAAVRTPIGSTGSCCSIPTRASPGCSLDIYYGRFPSFSGPPPPANGHFSGGKPEGHNSIPAGSP